jgi:hypothetical protein
LLNSADYTASNGTSVVLATACNSGDIVETIAFSSFSVANTVTSLSGGTTGLTPNTASTGNVVLAGTLATANGGTGLTTVGSSGQVLTTNGTTLSYGSALVTGTSVATTSGTSVVVATGIPSWVKRVTVAFNNISISSSTPDIYMQLGTGGSLTTSGYSGGGSRGTTALPANSTYLAIILNNGLANLYSGIVTLVTTGNNTWFSSGNITSNSTDTTTVSSGLVTLSGTLERIGLGITTGGITFDAGSVNILYE